MLGLGSLVSVLGKRFAKMTTVGAILVVVLGLAMFSQGTALAGISEGPENSQNTANPQNTGTSEDQGTSTDTTDSSNAADKTPQDENANNIQVIYSTLQRGRYPDIKVQTGVPIKWIINAPKGSLNGCNYRMLLRSFGIEHTLSEGENVIEFTPSKSGTFQYTCWMGMIRGNITVTDTLETSPTDPDTSTGAEETDPETEPFLTAPVWAAAEAKTSGIVWRKLVMRMFKKEWMIDMMEQKTILIVDDENMMREAVASYLEKQGYHVLQAETGTQALSLLEKKRFPL